MKISVRKYIVRNITKIIILLILTVGLFIVGTVIGFGILGRGKPSDVFHRDLWENVFYYFR
ncbi:MAG: DNA-directed RNA polymerase subunit beta [Lactobacillales bacterium]|jgi:C4-dicarboxylate transporter|nr:DNA-directed RNA polymerase subunit beta [Lactobacillales bacterium]